MKSNKHLTLPYLFLVVSLFPAICFCRGGELFAENCASYNGSKDLPLRVYAHQIAQKPYANITYRCSYLSTPISQMTPDGFNTVGELVAVDFWDFSGNSQGETYVTTQVPVSPDETCLAGHCGFALPSNDYLARIDDLPGTFDAFTAVDFNGTNRFDARAFASREETENEFLLCLEQTNMPLYVFSHRDGSGWYMEVGDHWESDPISCLAVIWQAGTCGADALPVYLSDRETHEGLALMDVVAEGTALLPSGHYFDVLLIRSLNDYGAHWMLDPTCVDTPSYDIHQYEYTWFAPYYGPVVTVESEIDAPDSSSWTTAENATFALGLFPPVSIEVQSSTVSSATISWNPGNDTRLLDRFKIYWDIDSSSAPPYTYAFNSDDHPQVDFNGNTATINALDSLTTYFITVTSVYSYTDPDSGITTEYESLLYPSQIYGTPDHAYPTEVKAFTSDSSCIPTTEVTGLYMVREGTDTRFMWDPVVGDTCLDHYEIFGADDPASWVYYTSVCHTSLDTDWTGNPALTYYLLAAIGPNGELGLVGHHGL